MHDRLIDRASARLVSGRVKLGVGESHGSGLFSRLRRHLQEGYTAIELDIVCQSCHVLEKETRRGELDLAIVTLLEEIGSATLPSRRRIPACRRAERAAAAGSERPLAGLGPMIAGDAPQTTTATGRKSSAQDCPWPLDRLRRTACRNRTGCCALAIPSPP